MPTRSSKDHDFVAVARSVVEKAIGEHMDGTPPENPEEGKNLDAMALGKLGGKKGWNRQSQQAFQKEAFRDNSSSCEG